MFKCKMLGVLVLGIPLLGMSHARVAQAREIGYALNCQAGVTATAQGTITLRQGTTVTKVPYTQSCHGGTALEPFPALTSAMGRVTNVSLTVVTEKDDLTNTCTYKTQNGVLYGFCFLDEDVLGQVEILISIDKP